MKVKVKICGIRSMEHAEQSVLAGADFLGFNFVQTSKRVITPAKAKEMSKLLKGRVALVGVFQDQSIDEVNAICSEADLDYVQLHGSENEDFCKQISVPVIKAFGLMPSVEAPEIAKNMERYNIPFYLLDRENRGEGGMVPLTSAAVLAESYPLFFAGALTPDNVAEVIRHVKPFAVDVAGGIETDGIHDIDKIKLFIKNAKEVPVGI